MKEVTPLEVKEMLQKNEDFQFIDVREPHEADLCSIGAELIPMGEVMSNLDKISKDKKVVVHCKSGGRSGTIVQMLESQGYTEVYNMKGGILRWSDEVDPTIQKY